MATIYQFLEHQATEDLEEMFGSEWCCLAMFQSFDAVAQHIVLRLLSIKGLVTTRLVQSWCRPGAAGSAACGRALAHLSRLHVIGHPPPPAPGTAAPAWKALDVEGMREVHGDVTAVMALHIAFKEGLQRALTTEHEAPWGEVTSLLPPLKSTPSETSIESFAARRWNSLLHYLVGSEDAPMPQPKVVELLVSTHLLAPGPEGTVVPGFEHDDDDGDDAGMMQDGAVVVDGDEAPVAGQGGGAAGRKRPRPASSPLPSAAPATQLTFDEILSVGGGAVHLTRKGYEFLLRDTSVQLWTFMVEYLRTARRRDMKATDILQFLFQLGLCRLGEGYAVAALSPTQRTLLADFGSFGLIHIPDKQQVSKKAWEAACAAARERGVTLGSEFRRFFPTSLAIVLSQPGTTLSTLAAGGAAQSSALASASTAVLGGPGGVGGGGVSPLASLSNPTTLLGPFTSALPQDANKLYLVVEKNFKIYAYTSVDLHLALLALFAKIETRFANLVVATLTRRSVMQAMERGMSAQLIHHFLIARVHPSVAARVAAEMAGATGLAASSLDADTIGRTAVPQSVIDQLYLWQRERHRVSFSPAHLVSHFESVAMFRHCVAIAKSVGGCLAANEADTCLVVAAEAYDAFLAAVSSGGTDGANGGR